MLYGQIHKLGPQGKLEWSYTTAGWSSPTIGSDGTIYVGGSNYIYALYPDGFLKWKFDIGRTIHSSITIDTNDTLYFGATDYYYSVHPNGTFNWKFKTADGPMMATPAISTDGSIHFILYTHLWSLFHLRSLHHSNTKSRIFLATMGI